MIRETCAWRQNLFEKSCLRPQNRGPINLKWSKLQNLEETSSKLCNYDENTDSTYLNQSNSRNIGDIPPAKDISGSCNPVISHGPLVSDQQEESYYKLSPLKINPTCDISNFALIDHFGKYSEHREKYHYLLLSYVLKAYKLRMILLFMTERTNRCTFPQPAPPVSFCTQSQLNVQVY